MTERGGGVLPHGLRDLLGPFLARQGWVRAALGMDGNDALECHLVEAEVLAGGRPGLASLVLDAGERPRRRLHVALGWRDVREAAEHLDWAAAALGEAEDGSGEVLCYDALADHELRLRLLTAATGGERAGRARLVRSLVSHASIVYDERLLMKCYRVIEPGVRPEIEVLRGLDRVGFNRLLAPVASWSRGGKDLAIVREFIPDALEGRELARTSLRDLFGRAVERGGTPPFSEVGYAGGDLSEEMRRLGETTAELHLALAEAFGTTPSASGEGCEIRVHGDYHLRRVMRSDSGWLVAGFGDDPLVGRQAGEMSQAGPTRTTPLEDVADLVVSMQQAAEEAASLQPASFLEHARTLAGSWVRHNSGAFLAGYLAAPGISSIVPAAAADAEAWVEAELEARSESGRAVQYW